MTERVRARAQTNIVTNDQVRSELERERANNYDPTSGYSLVNVMPWEQFVRVHIPGSINIARGGEAEFDYLFDKRKEIIIYDASPLSNVSSAVTHELLKRGFKNVVDYAGGLHDWQVHGGEVHQFHLEGDY